jgi:hypothetical protein
MPRAVNKIIRSANRLQPEILGVDSTLHCSDKTTGQQTSLANGRAIPPRGWASAKNPGRNHLIINPRQWDTPNPTLNVAASADFELSFVIDSSLHCGLFTELKPARISRIQNKDKKSMGCEIAEDALN